MPTGYTAIIEDDPNSTFRDYALRCARAFGAMVTFRDESIDGKLPESVEPHDYHVKALATAREELARVKGLTGKETDDAAKRGYETDHASWVKSRENDARKASRYQSIRADVERWVPPTTEHYGVKKFMLEQIDLCLPSFIEPIERYWKEPKPKSGIEWRTKQVEKCNEDIEYHTKHYTEEVERCANATAWLQSYVASLPKATEA